MVKKDSGPTIEQRAIETLRPYDRNARTHSPEQIAQLRASILEFGFTSPVLVTPEGQIVAGHGRVEAAKSAGLKQVPTLVVGEDWTPDQIRAYVLADNKLALNAGWDDELLAREIGDLSEANFSLSLIGFDEAELASILSNQVGSGGANAGDGKPDQRGTLLSRVDITIDDPKYPVQPGDHFLLSKRHHLLCVSVMEDWPRWSPLLVTGAIFCPYAGPFTPFGEKPKTVPLVMVQPDPYIAGHMLDHWVACFGEAAVEAAP